MNSFRYRSSRSIKAAFAVALAAGTLAFPANAQDRASPPPVLALPASAEENAPLPPVSLPQGATIDGAQEKVRTMATEAGRSLEDLIGSSVTPRTEAEIGEMAARQRRIMLLEDQLREAKLAKELWVELNGESDEDNAEIERLHAEKASLEAELVRLSASRIVPPSDPDPVVASITGAAGEMRAKVLVPYMGEVMAERGTNLPNGMKVVNISGDGVTVMDGDKRKTLAFGTSVPKSRPVAVSRTSGPSLPGGNIMQIGQ